MMVKFHRQRRDALACKRPQRRKKNGVPIFKHMTAKSLDARFGFAFNDHLAVGLFEGLPARVVPLPAETPELIDSGFYLENADAPLLHAGLNHADLAHVLDLHQRGVIPEASARRSRDQASRPRAARS